MSFWRERHNWKRQIFMYKMTLGKSFSLHGDPEKLIHFGWLEAPTTLSPSLLEELEIVQVTDHGGSWMKRMLTLYLFLEWYQVTSCSCKHFANIAWSFW